eukprot:SM000009S23608  [mRNA]  locus=s9:1047161:1049205:- [translate_table: standard]
MPAALAPAPPSPAQFLHRPVLTLEWTPEEDRLLEDTLAKCPPDKYHQSLLRYIKVAASLPEKTVRDVALRCRWLTKKENGKRRKGDESAAAKKSKDKRPQDKEPVKLAPNGSVTAPPPPPPPPPPVALRPMVPLYTAPPLPPVDSDDGISNDGGLWTPEAGSVSHARRYSRRALNWPHGSCWLGGAAIGGTTGQLLEQNAQAISQVRANLAACKAQDNVLLLLQIRDNISSILNGMTSMPGIMSQMPPLPVKLNLELANTLLPKGMGPLPPAAAPGGGAGPAPSVSAAAVPATSAS